MCNSRIGEEADSRDQADFDMEPTVRQNEI